ncbi:MAG: MarR family transcriptional regulator, partial [Janthinobacterium lividum]|nr:MarR family transcriptional regulator [Janthinobacterium lividum]
HEGWIAELLQGVTPDDKSQLIDLLSHMKQQLNDIAIKA